MAIKTLKNIEEYHTHHVRDRAGNKDNKPTWLLIEEILCVVDRENEVCFRATSQMDQKELVRIYNYIYELENQIRKSTNE